MDEIGVVENGQKKVSQEPLSQKAVSLCLGEEDSWRYFSFELLV